ncbi:hypothetical protein E2C01_059139 [Portunus trituberculatus]|uniref:Uncharacterized protein n=1 Tax=Portunus trituberculatus TaxID=210409 RepID=A0A5B7H508_PORTR|nr:hypothetical protein [Portunus trituberculatus]
MRHATCVREALTTLVRMCASPRGSPVVSPARKEVQDSRKSADVSGRTASLQVTLGSLRTRLAALKAT